MKLFVETDSGRQIEVKKIQSVPDSSSVLLFRMSFVLDADYTARIERALSDKIGIPCVIVPSFTDTIWGV